MFANGVVAHVGYNPLALDYGNVLVVKHQVDGVGVWGLYGHLDARSSKEVRRAVH